MNLAVGFVLAALMSLGLAGCQDLRGLWASQQRPPEDPAFRWETEPTSILDLKGPSEAPVGAAVTLQVQAVIGSSSCNRAGEVLLDVDHGARTVGVRATRLAKKADQPLACTDDFGWTTLTATFSPLSTGTYRVTAQDFKAGYGLPGEPPARGAFDLTVTP